MEAGPAGFAEYLRRMGEAQGDRVTWDREGGEIADRRLELVVVRRPESGDGDIAWRVRPRRAGAQG